MPNRAINIIEKINEKLATGCSIGIKVKIIAGAPKNEIVEEMADDTIKIRIAAQAQEGKANEELINFLSETFSRPKSAIIILSGLTSPIKIVKIN